MIILEKYTSRHGNDIVITAPTNAAEVLSKLKMNTFYEITHVLHNSEDTLIGEFMGATDYNKSMRFKRSTNGRIEAVVPTQNILDIVELN